MLNDTNCSGAETVYDIAEAWINTLIYYFHVFLGSEASSTTIKLSSETLCCECVFVRCVPKLGDVIWHILACDYSSFLETGLITSKFPKQFQDN